MMRIVGDLEPGSSRCAGRCPATDGSRGRADQRRREVFRRREDRSRNQRGAARPPRAGRADRVDRTALAVPPGDRHLNRLARPGHLPSPPSLIDHVTAAAAAPARPGPYRRYHARHRAHQPVDGPLLAATTGAGSEKACHRDSAPRGLRPLPRHPLVRAPTRTRLRRARFRRTLRVPDELSLSTSIIASSQTRLSQASRAPIVISPARPHHYLRIGSDRVLKPRFVGPRRRWRCRWRASVARASHRVLHGLECRRARRPVHRPPRYRSPGGTVLGGRVRHQLPEAALSCWHTSR